VLAAPPSRAIEMVGADRFLRRFEEYRPFSTDGMLPHPRDPIRTKGLTRFACDLLGALVRMRASDRHRGGLRVLRPLSQCELPERARRRVASTPSRARPYRATS